MTKVTGTKRVRASLLGLAWVLAGIVCALGQDSATASSSRPELRSAEALYLALKSAALDKTRVYNIREASLDHAALHITLDDGTIAFTQDVAGHVTGAFFEGEGEVLLIPPNQVERGSMALFTGAAILEEKFGTAYFRFNDGTFTELQPFLRTAENAGDFVTTWNSTAANLAQTDALRLLQTFSQWLPVRGTPNEKSAETDKDDHFLHARVQGNKLGGFDLYYDSTAIEQIVVGQLKTAEGSSYYDVWTSFTVGVPGVPHEAIDAARVEQGTSAVEISDYQIHARVTPPTELDADATLQLQVRRGGRRTVLFQLSRFLRVERVEADGYPVEFIHNETLEGTQLARHGDDLVAVVFPESLRTNQIIKLRFVYAGDVLSDAGSGLLYVGARGNWYPNRGLAMAQFDLEFRYPAGWTLLATGKRVDTPSDKKPGPYADENEQFSHWISERPVPLAGFNLGKYERAVAHAGDVTVETYAAANVERSFPKAPEVPIFDPRHLIDRLRLPTFPPLLQPPPPSPAKNAQTVADTSARAINFFARSFGPFPYSSLKLTQMPGELSQGWPGIVFLSSFAFLAEPERAALHMNPIDRIENDVVIAHETAHQWWGDLVTWNSYRDQWLLEALANYSSLMLLEANDPAKFRLLMDNYRNALLEKQKSGAFLMEAGPVTLGSRLSCSRFPKGYEAISYGRGTWLFHMLRGMTIDGERKAGVSAKTSDDPFLRTLRKVREQSQGKAISSRELLQAFEDEMPRSVWYEGKKSLDWFYEGWISGTAIPRIDLKNVKYTDAGGSTAVTGTILQKDASDQLVTPIPIYAVLARKNVLLGRVFAEGPETGFRLSAPAGTRKLVVDPNQTLLIRTH